MINHIKCVTQLIVLIGLFSFSQIGFAGAFEDFFTAAKRDDARSLQALIQRGFDVNTINEAGDTALLVAVREPSPGVIDALLRVKTLKVDPRSKIDETPLMLAALRGDKALVQTFLERDADVNKTGWTPLHYAATNGHVAVMQLLLERSAYIDTESPNKSTPLMMAAMYGSAEAVKLLIDEGADITLKNEHGLTALDFAVQASRPDAQKLLREALAAKPSPGTNATPAPKPLPKGGW